MPLSDTERKRRYRESRRQEARKLPARVAPDDAADLMAASFAAFLSRPEHRQELSFINETLESVGIQKEAPDWSKDEDPEWHTHDWEAFTPDRKLLGKTERVIGGFIDIARALATLVNQYKREQVEAAIADLEKADLSDPQAKRHALAEAVRLNQLLARLNKETRESFPVHTVKEE